MVSLFTHFALIYLSLLKVLAVDHAAGSPLLTFYPSSSQVLSRQGLWNTLLTHYKENGCLVEGPLSNLKQSLVQLHRPKRVRGEGGKGEGVTGRGG